MNIIVLAKQVPDTRNVGKDAMREDGTVNRTALPAIFNPEDLNALEQALRIKDQYPDTTISVLTMGPFRAADVIREALYRGADRGYLLTDRAFAGADTLATSYALAMAIRHIGMPDLILSGRQAIDGDTAQVGPQVAHKLGLPTVTYAEELEEINAKEVIVRRRLEHGVERVKASLPLLITVNGSSAPCRPRNAKALQKYKYAMVPNELGEASEMQRALFEARPYLQIAELSAADVKAELEQCGLLGSPTKVKTIENVVFQAKEARHYEANDEGISSLIVELIANHTIG
ncbi:electron transfer flavoprotein subunit beta/FixA family protein [Porphyromonas endodontalis]|uniref:Electron transfer flavoprotein domain protein n=1 Tax=Porphyromonas endodontalis (strain ATCC 35406 / DSM 24491 / JCM 8526 / CCUG 16442 / BCRC 14492 / NCTC 13058 / HG 370) TaxID=553175 RepID=C3J8A6_POREA|nr:electron transfer flavoprotein subunit beta/FixA family protein [Porphyromonas endodontalis]EEN83730.1 electron transfer flavoprotein domain protein [Porphyromonas endodontalis ATCC 35406]UBH63855.1 electron transfer flavoprotein subunit beta/FixA family protein [Porphyromonas endodontalis]SUB67897.1 Electron transfer flavoprotein small subunit [Porphyromonas endodontalis]